MESESQESLLNHVTQCSELLEHMLRKDREKSAEVTHVELGPDVLPVSWFAYNSSRHIGIKGDLL